MNTRNSDSAALPHEIHPKEKAGAGIISSYIISLWHYELTKYFLSVLIVVISGLLLYSFKDNISYHAVSLLFLFIISLLPLLNFKPGHIFLSAMMSAFIWNYFFIPPAYTLRIGSVEDVLMYFIYLVTATVSGLLISRIRTQQLTLDQKEKRTAALYELSRDLSASGSIDDLTAHSVSHIRETFKAEAVFIYSENEKYLSKFYNPFSSIKIDDGEWNIAQMVYISSMKTGPVTGSVPSISRISYFPLLTKERKLGVAGIMFPENYVIDTDTQSLIDAFLNQVSIAAEREFLKKMAQQNMVAAESEKLYKVLFDSISHELKTPITTLVGAVSSFKDERIIQNKKVFFGLIDETNIAVERLKRLVDNLLDITRIESGKLRLKKEWHSVADLVHSAVCKMKAESVAHNLICRVSENSGLYYFDYALVEHAIMNIIHNSTEYTPNGSTIEVFAERNDNEIIISVSDDGNGIPEKELKNIFKKFYRVPGTKAGGTGLGLSIARGFIEAHGGTIAALNKNTGGAQFIISLPIDK